MSELRRLIGASGMSRNAIAGTAGLPDSTLSRLMSGERPSLTVETAERIAAAIGYELTITRRREKGKGKHGKAK